VFDADAYRRRDVIAVAGMDDAEGLDLIAAGIGGIEDARQPVETHVPGNHSPEVGG
jgi:hypothetical protein